MAQRVTLHLRNGKSATSVVRNPSEVQAIIDVLYKVWDGELRHATFTFPGEPAMHINAVAVDLLEIVEVP